MRFRRLAGGTGSTVLLALATLALTVGAPEPASAQLGFGGLINVSQNAPSFSRQPHIAVDGANVLHIVWADDEDGVYRIKYVQRLPDGSFRFRQTLSGALAGGIGSSLRPRLAVLGASVYVVWMQDPFTAQTSDEKEIMFSRSVDGGQSFQAPQNLSGTPGNSQEGRVAVSPNGTVFVVWDELSGGRHIRMRRSFDGGASFAGAQVLFVISMTTSTDPAAPTGAKTPYPGIAVDQSTGAVYLIWHDLVAGQPQVLFARSLPPNNGADFSGPLQVSQPPTGLHAHCASITVGPSGKILVAFEQRKQITPHRHDAYFAFSANGGASFSTPVNLSNGLTLPGGGEFFSDYPWAVEGPSGLIVVGWEDNTDSPGRNLQAVVRTSTDGFNFTPLQIVSNTATTSTEVVTLFGQDGVFYIIWEEQQSDSGPGEVLMRTAGTPGSLFADVPPGYWAQPWIGAIYANGITGGCATAPLRYCPEAAVTRAEMAVFLVKAMHPGFTPPPATGLFADVPPGYWAAPYIEQLNRDGVTGGCGGGRFCPDNGITRAEMAVFLINATRSPVGPVTGLFADVPPGYWAAAWIEQLARNGVTGGCAPGLFCPAGLVTRAQMAVFLVNAFGLPT